MRRIVVAATIAWVVVTGCERVERDDEQAGDRAREAAREAGGAVGRALEETGEAIQEAGKRLERQSEAAAGDSSEPAPR